MLYQIEVATKPELTDQVSEGIRTDIADLGIKGVKDVRFTQIYLVEGDISQADIELIAGKILSDPVLHRYEIRHPKSAISAEGGRASFARGEPEELSSLPLSGRGRGNPKSVITVYHKPGVMDPVEASTLKGITDLGFHARAVRTGRKFVLTGRIRPKDKEQIARKILANEVIDDIFYDSPLIEKIIIGTPYQFQLQTVPLKNMSLEEMDKINKDWQLSLNEQELKTIQNYFQSLNRDPTDVELETIAQTWSEHCKHKTMMGLIEYKESNNPVQKIDNLLKETVMKVTTELNKPWCISVFKDNAGIIDFDEENAVCFKVETHNHPSAIEPYGGAGTGIGGVIRDILGCGLGAKPILNTDVFAFGPPNLRHKRLPAGVLHPKRIAKGVVAGVRDYGNRMGIPTSNGAVYFDERYTGNPLVYCGTVGLMPRDKCVKNPQAGDLILLVGGRTGRDGIHGVTFASAELTEKSEEFSSIAVQIGNAIMEKKVLDTVLAAREAGLYSAITDCGGGGLSSAVGEMGRDLGCVVDLDKVPLKYEGLTYSEIWISEAQERMILSVPPQHQEQILEIFRKENVEAIFIGQFTGDKRLVLKYKGTEVANLDMEFLHHGLPKFSRLAEWHRPKHPEPKLAHRLPRNYGKMLQQILGMWNIASKEWIIRQYDHEVQGGSTVKPLVGVKNDGPSDACVVRPLLNSHRGLIIANGMNPKYGDIDPYQMAAGAIDEALRNIVAVGGNLDRTALLDNFSWGNTNKPARLGALVRACQACYDIAKIYETPFISGKDSLNNEFRIKDKTIAIPHTLLISAISVIDDVRKTVTMDLKSDGNLIYLVGMTKSELGGSHYYDLLGYLGNSVPEVDAKLGRKIMQSLFSAIQSGYVKSCHDLSEGGLAVAIAEMAFAGEVGVKINLADVPRTEMVKRDDIILFSESPSRFLVEVTPTEREEFEKTLNGCPFALIGQTAPMKMLRINGLDGRLIVNEPLSRLKDAWQKPLKW